MAILLIISVLSQGKPGPVDAFRANLAAVRVKTIFECKFYDKADYSAISQQLERFAPGPGLAEEPSYIVRGRWDYDGSCEHYVTRIIGGSKHDPSGRSGPLPACELIWDGETYAYHYLAQGESALHVETKVLRPPLLVVGSFTWYRRYRLDRELDSEYTNAEIERKSLERGGRMFEVEIYNKTNRQFHIRREIAYDPEIGYLPRHSRAIAYGSAKDGRSGASVQEMYLIEARLCAAGGFVPSEWYVVGYHIDEFESKYPNYSDETRLTPSNAPRLIHFRLERMEDLKGPVVFDELEGVSQIVAPGGIHGSKGSFPRMSLKEMKQLLGGKAIPSNEPLIANIDHAELHEFDEPKQRVPWFAYLIAGLVVIALFWCVLAWRRGRVLLTLLLFCVLAGCGQRPVAHIMSAFSPSRLVYDASRPSLQVGLVVSNTGNQPLQIFSVDAGCSCRQVDKSQLPVSLPPGESRKFWMSLGGPLNYNNQIYGMTFHTDHGRLVAEASLFALPDHHISPQSVTMNGLYEGVEEKEDSFEIVHREIFHPAVSRAATQLVPPSEFTMRNTRTVSGHVAGAPEYEFKDTTYRLTLTDRRIGLQRAEILLRGTDGRRIVVTPIVWQRLPFLSSTPSRVVLSTQPMRAFLRCPDETVELLRILSVPKGVKAVLGSPREVVLSPGGDAPGAVQGFVEVETTATGRPPLRIPVVRYAPLAARR